mmetsp:Transcript_67588/g.180663  ORF Transcript_67588/g.180663 Transcript_67588/m.180663 type:complete len:180 (+) Transcript_67588:874-1413(+)
MAWLTRRRRAARRYHDQAFQDASFGHRRAGSITVPPIAMLDVIQSKVGISLLLLSGVRWACGDGRCGAAEAGWRSELDKASEGAQASCAALLWSRGLHALLCLAMPCAACLTALLPAPPASLLSPASLPARQARLAEADVNVDAARQARSARSAPQLLAAWPQPKSAGPTPDPGWDPRG